MNEKRTEKHEQARNSLPDDLKPIFDRFVNDYKFHGMTRYGSPFVSYIILADMIREGWRLTAQPIAAEDSEKPGEATSSS
jgi:hypothetical protein